MTGTSDKTFIRAWRKYRRLTLEQLAETVGVTHGTLSRIERGLRPYNQPLLEALGHALDCKPADLLARDPGDPQGLWAIWDSLSAGERAQAAAVLQAFKEAAPQPFAAAEETKTGPGHPQARPARARPLTTRAKKRHR